MNISHNKKFNEGAIICCVLLFFLVFNETFSLFFNNKVNVKNPQNYNEKENYAEKIHLASINFSSQITAINTTYDINDFRFDISDEKTIHIAFSTSDLKLYYVNNSCTSNGTFNTPVLVTGPSSWLTYDIGVIRNEKVSLMFAKNTTTSYDVFVYTRSKITTPSILNITNILPPIHRHLSENLISIDTYDNITHFQISCEYIPSEPGDWSYYGNDIGGNYHIISQIPFGEFNYYNGFIACTRDDYVYTTMEVTNGFFTIVCNNTNGGVFSPTQTIGAPDYDGHNRITVDGNNILHGIVYGCQDYYGDKHGYYYSNDEGDGIMGPYERLDPLSGLNTGPDGWIEWDPNSNQVIYANAHNGIIKARYRNITGWSDFDTISTGGNYFKSTRIKAKPSFVVIAYLGNPDMDYDIFIRTNEFNKNSAPEIINIDFNPKSPITSDLITINANVIDNDLNLNTVKLWYKANTSLWQSKIMTYSGGSQYSGTIGPYGYNTYIKYYIEAEDSLGLMATYPIYAPTHFFKIEIGESDDPIWKRMLKDEILELKNEIRNSIEYSLELVSEMISTTINDSVDFTVGEIIGKIVNRLGRYAFGNIIDKIELQKYMDETGAPADQIEQYIDFFWELALDNPLVGGCIASLQTFLSGISKFLTDELHVTKAEIYDFLKTNDLVENILHIQSSLNQLEQEYINLVNWLNGIPNDLPSFDIESILGIIESIRTNIHQGIKGSISHIITHNGSIYPTSSIHNIKAQFDMVHLGLEIGTQVEQIIDVISKISLAVSIITTATGVGASVGAVAGTVHAATEVASGIVKVVKIGAIIAEVADSIISILELKNQLENYPIILKKAVSFIQDNYITPIDFENMSIQIVDVNSPNIVLGSVGSGSISIKNTGTLGGNLVVAVTIRAPDNTPLHRYYMSEYLNPDETFVFNTYYFGHPSDFFGLLPYTIEFKCYLHGKYLALEKSQFYVGLASIIDAASNLIVNAGSFLIEFGTNAWTQITTSLGDVWTTITGGDAQSNVDLRLWDENKTTLLVGLNYTTNEMVNLINADYSGPSANPEYIRIPDPDGTNYSLEIVGVDLPFEENTSVIYINTEQRNATLGAPIQINESNFFYDGQSGNLTIGLPINEAGGQNNLTGLKINSTNLSFSGKVLNLLSDISDINLTAGETKLLLLNYSYTSDIIEGNYTGTIMIWNGTTLMHEIPITIEMLNESNLKNLEFPEIPIIGTPIPSTAIEGKDATITVTVVDDKEIDKVFLLYSTDALKSWKIVEMSPSGGNKFIGTIPMQPAFIVVYYQIYAFDNESLMKIEDNDGLYYSLTFQEAPEEGPSEGAPPSSVLIIIIISAIAAVAIVIVIFIKYKILPERAIRQRVKVNLNKKS